MKNIRAFVFLLSAYVVFALPLNAKEFSVLVHNVNNCFDLDGIAHFDEYKQGAGKDWAPKKLLTKIRNLSEVLKRVDGEKGPDIILFQELEYDFTPESSVVDYEAFLAQYKALSLAEMLGEAYDASIAGLPVEALLLKQFKDIGFHDYSIAVVKDRSTSAQKHKMPHVNVVFSRFPIASMRKHKVSQAREILECKVMVDGHPLYLFNNHWKSGRGGFEMTEAIRVQNAKVLKDRLEQLLSSDPMSDIILGGDFNSSYNIRERYPSIQTVALHDVLGVRGDESAMLTPGAPFLYDLWYELPREARFSDVYRGEYGTLMHIILSEGLYDGRGIQYVDQSFRVLRYDGLNTKNPWQVPLRPWISGDTGGGHSDHFPLYARFRILRGASDALELTSPGRPSPKDKEVLEIPYANIKQHPLESATLLGQLTRAEMEAHFGKVFKIKASIHKNGPSVILGKQRFRLFAFDRSLYYPLRQLEGKGEVSFYGELQMFKGRLEFIIRDASWIEP